MVVYRKMMHDDVLSVHAIEVESFPVPWTLDSFYYELEENQFSHYLVAEEDDKIIGFCGMWLTIDAAQITNVAVSQSARGRKIGEALMVEAIRVAREAGMETMNLEVRVSNEVALNLYRKLGFMAGGIRKGYYSDNFEDALVMWVKL